MVNIAVRQQQIWKQVPTHAGVKVRVLMHLVTSAVIVAIVLHYQELIMMVAAQIAVHEQMSQMTHVIQMRMDFPSMLTISQMMVIANTVCDVE